MKLSDMSFDFDNKKSFDYAAKQLTDISHSTSIQVLC
jgi:hypothetical protein